MSCLVRWKNSWHLFLFTAIVSAKYCTLLYIRCHYCHVHGTSFKRLHSRMAIYTGCLWINWTWCSLLLSYHRRHHQHLRRKQWTIQQFIQQWISKSFVVHVYVKWRITDFIISFRRACPFFAVKSAAWCHVHADLFFLLFYLRISVHFVATNPKRHANSSYYSFPKSTSIGYVQSLCSVLLVYFYIWLITIYI